VAFVTDKREPPVKALGPKLKGGAGSGFAGANNYDVSEFQGLVSSSFGRQLIQTENAARKAWSAASGLPEAKASIHTGPR
jgi:hypothetical protein